MGREGTEGGPGGTTPITSKESARVASANKTQETSKDGVQGHDSLPIAPAIAGFKSTGRTNILSNVSPSMEASTSYESLTAVGLVSPSIQGSTGVERNLNEKALSTKGGLLVSKGSVNAFPCKEAECNANPEMSRKGTPLSYKHMLQGKKLEPSLAARLPSKDEKTLQPHAGNANGTDQKEACVPASVLENTEKSGDASNTLVAKGKANRPVEIIPCPRCKSVETKFCYYNNYNVRQPRHFCRSCQRYWTAGGTLRNVPVGAGRRKNKSSSVGHANSLVNDESKSTDGPGPLKPGALHFSRTDASMGSRMYPLAAHTFITPGTCPPIGSIHSTADLITKEAARTLHPEALGRKSHSPDVDEVTHLSLGRKTDNSLGSSGTVRGGSRHLVNSSEDQSSGEGEELTKQNKDAAKVQGIRVHRFNNPSIHPGYLGGPLAVGPHPWMQGMIPGLPWVKPIEQIPPKAGTKPEVQPAFPPVIPNYQGYIWPGAGYFPYGWIQDPQSPGWNAAVAASIGYSPLNMAQSPSLSYSQHPQGQQVPIAPIPVDRLGPNIASNRTQYGGGWIPMWPAGQPLATKPGTQNPTSTPVVTQAGTSRGVSTWEGRKGSGSTTLGKHSRSPETMR